MARGEAPAPSRLGWGGHPRLRLLVCAALFLLLALGHSPRLSGDEPHYLMTTLSILKDGDLNLFNNYQRGDFRELGYAELRPQWGPEGERVIPEHGVGFPLLLAGPYALGGLRGVKLFLLALAVLAAWLMARASDQAGCRPLTGTLALGLMLLSPAWLMHADKVFPETTAGCLFLAALVMLGPAGEGGGRHGRWRLGLVGLMVGAFPLLYLKYTPLGLALGLYCLWRPDTRRSPAFYAGLGIALAAWAGATAAVYGLDLFAGAGGEAGDFAWRGFWGRLACQWLDRRHGLLVLQPAFALLPLALVCLLLARGVPDRAWAACAGLGVLLYAAMYGLFTGHPGVSIAGRYLCAGLPAQAWLLALWCDGLGPGGRWARWPALALAGVSAGVGLWLALGGGPDMFYLNLGLAPAWWLEQFRACWVR